MFEDVNTSPSLEGDMSIPGKRTTTTTAQNGIPDYNTLDEPIRETVLRDIRAVGIKFYHVLYPKEKSSLLRDCTSSFIVMYFVCVSIFIMRYLLSITGDLWGPLVLCTFMATILQGSSSVDSMSDNGPEFAQVFVIVWIGAAIVTLNSKLLGGNMYVSPISLDYLFTRIYYIFLLYSLHSSFFQSVCVLGYCLTPVALALIVCRIILLSTQTRFLFFLRFVTTTLGFAWATYGMLLSILTTLPWQFHS